MAPQSDGASLAQLEVVLRKQLEVANSLLRVLNQEYDAIRTRDAQTLIELAPEKLEGLTALEALETQKQTPSDPEAFPEEAQSLWYRVLDVVRLCQRKNQLNGVMLDMRMQSTNTALDLISGRDSTQVTYSPDGKASATHQRSGTAILA